MARIVIVVLALATIGATEANASPQDDHPPSAVMNFLGRNICLELNRLSYFEGHKIGPVVISSRIAFGSDEARHEIFIEGVGGVVATERAAPAGSCVGADEKVTRVKVDGSVDACVGSTDGAKRALVHIAPAIVSPAAVEKVVFAVSYCGFVQGPEFYVAGNGLAFSQPILIAR